MLPTSVHFLPSALEDFWTAQLPGDPASAIDQLLPEIQFLSDNFTVDRPARFRDYFRRPLSLPAYGVFFFPQTWTRVRFALAEIFQLWGWRPYPDNPTCRILDLGSGMGPAGLSAAQMLAAAFPAIPLDLTLLDYSPDSLQLGEKVRSALRPDLPSLARFRTQTADFAAFRTLGDLLSEDPYDLILCSFALNEAFPNEDDDRVLRWLDLLLQNLSPRGLVLLLEPALRPASERLFRLQHLAATQSLAFPCGPHPHGSPCPLLAGGRFWPHEVRRWRPPALLSRANRTLWRQISELKFSFIGLSLVRPDYAEPSPRRFRLDSPFSRQKGRFLFAAIAGDGARYEYDLQFRDLPPDSLPHWEQLERGDTLEASRLEPHGQPGRFRIPSADSLQIVWQPA